MTEGETAETTGEPVEAEVLDLDAIPNASDVGLVSGEPSGVKAYSTEEVAGINLVLRGVQFFKSAPQYQNEKEDKRFAVVSITFADTGKQSEFRGGSQVLCDRLDALTFPCKARVTRKLAASGFKYWTLEDWVTEGETDADPEE